MTPAEYRNSPAARDNALRLQQRCTGTAVIRLDMRERQLVALALSMLLADLAPVDIVLYCPKCATQHLDAPEADPPGAAIRRRGAWTNPPHRTHLCAACGHLWRPSDTPTNGVQATQSGKDADCEPLAAAQLRAFHDAINTGYGEWQSPAPSTAGRRGPLTEAQRMHARAIAANNPGSVAAVIAFVSATAYVNGVQDHKDITITPVFGPGGVNPGLG